MKNRPFFVEIKYDGERMQLHKKDGEFKYFSRRYFNFIELFNVVYRLNYGVVCFLAQSVYFMSVIMIVSFISLSIRFQFCEL